MTTKLTSPQLESTILLSAKLRTSSSYHGIVKIPHLRSVKSSSINALITLIRRTADSHWQRSYKVPSLQE
jgi:hypothetical protein